MFGGVGNPTLSSFGCFTPPSESQAITTLKKRSAIAQHYKKSARFTNVRQSANLDMTLPFGGTPEKALHISPKLTSVLVHPVTTNFMNSPLQAVSALEQENIMARNE